MRLAPLGIALGIMCVTILGCDLMRTFFPSSAHAPVPPALPEQIKRPAVLVFSKTNGYRHEAAIEAGIPALEAIAQRRGPGRAPWPRNSASAPWGAQRGEAGGA